MSTTPTKPEIQQVARILSHISLLCSVITDQINEQDSTDPALLLQSHFQRIGMLSDLALTKLGEEGFRGTSVYWWLMP